MALISTHIYLDLGKPFFFFPIFANNVSSTLEISRNEVRKYLETDE